MRSSAEIGLVEELDSEAGHGEEELDEDTQEFEFVYPG
jgi:hypothetical protein